MRRLLAMLLLVPVFAFAHELRDFQAQGVFVSNYLMVQLQQVRADCQHGEQRAIALHMIGPLVLTGCWKREGRTLALKLEDGTIITRHLGDVTWCSGVGDTQCGKLNRIALRVAP